MSGAGIEQVWLVVRARFSFARIAMAGAALGRVPELL
jgi:hypothetical protein